MNWQATLARRLAAPLSFFILPPCLVDAAVVLQDIGLEEGLDFGGVVVVVVSQL